METIASLRRKTGLTQQQLAAESNEHDRTYLENKAAGLDRQIDELTYDLYGLTPEERDLVQTS